MDKSDFSKYRASVLEARKLRTRLDSLQGELCSLPAPVDETTAKKYAEALAYYRDLMLAKIAGVKSIEAAVESLEAPEERLVLRLRYIEGHDWHGICKVLRPLGYSERQVYRLHGFALQKLKEV